MSALQKYVFRIRTRNGLVVENLSVQARDRAEAERRISQIYHYCEVLECQANAAAARPGTTDLEAVIGLISDTRATAADAAEAPAVPLDGKPG